MTWYKACFRTLLIRLACDHKDVIFQAKNNIQESLIESNSLTTGGISFLVNLMYINNIILYKLKSIAMLLTKRELILMAVIIMQWRWSDKPAYNLNKALSDDNHMRHLVVKT